MTIPIGNLQVEAHMTSPPKPIGFHVTIDDKIVAVLSFDIVERAYKQYVAMKGMADD